MYKIRNILLAVLALGVINAGCVSAEKKQAQSPSDRHAVMIPPLHYVGPEDKTQWNGEIEGRSVSYFRSKKERESADVIVVTHDDLPLYFKRIEYLDKSGDGSLDLVRMKIYEKDTGWRGVGITQENKYGLEYADKKYKELLQKIRKERDVQNE
jgi:hypothetical protein